MCRCVVSENVYLSKQYTRYVAADPFFVVTHWHDSLYWNCVYILKLFEWYVCSLYTGKFQYTLHFPYTCVPPLTRFFILKLCTYLKAYWMVHQSALYFGMFQCALHFPLGFYACVCTTCLLPHCCSQHCCVTLVWFSWVVPPWWVLKYCSYLCCILVIFHLHGSTQPYALFKHIFCRMVI